MTKGNSNSALSIHEWANIQNIASNSYRTCSLHRIRKELGARKSLNGGDSDGQPQLAMDVDVSAEASQEESAPEILRDEQVEPKHLDYQTLFAETEAAGPVDHDSSILSPAAYFVDLMRLIEAKITNGEQNDWKGLEDLKLEKRRRDLWEIELDAKNTTTEVPYLEIVNDVMRTHLPEVAGSDEEGLSEEQKQRKRKRLARQYLAKAQYPFDMPVQMPLEQIRTCLAHFGVKLTDVYETFGLPEDDDAWVAEALGLSPVERTHISEWSKGGEGASWNALGEAYGLPGKLSDEHHGGLEKVEIFLKQTGLVPEALDELMQLLELSLVKRPDGEGPADPHCIKGLNRRNLSTLDYVIRLRRLLNWSVGDLGLVLILIAGFESADKRSLFQLAQFKKLSAKYKLPVDVLCSFVSDMNINPGFAGPNKAAPRALFDRVFNTPPFYHSAEASTKGAEYHPWETEPLPWKSGAQDPRNQGIRTSLLAALNLGNDDLQAIINHLCDEHQFDKWLRLDAKKLQLDVPTLTRFYRFSKIASALGLHVQEYLVLLKCITGPGEQRLEVPEVSGLDDLSVVGYWADWLKEAARSPYQLEYLTTGKLTGEAQRRFDPGWTDEGFKQFTRELRDTLETRLVKAQTFVQGTISSEEAAAAVTALRKAGLIVGAGLVQCPVPEASDGPGDLPRVIPSQVCDALESLSSSSKSFEKLTGAGKPQGNANTLAVSSDRQTVYGATADGVFCGRWEDSKWVKPACKTPSPDSIKALLAVTPDGKTVFAATEDQLYQSTNYGESWGNLKAKGLSRAYFTALAVTPDGKTLYAGTDDGLYYSTNGGNNWEHITLEFPPNTSEKVTAIAVGPDGQSLFAAIQTIGPQATDPKKESFKVLSNDVFRSADAGMTWEKTDVPLDTDDTIDSLSVNFRGKICCTCKAKGVFNGYQWSSFSSTDTESTIIAAVMADTDGEIIIAVNNNGKFQCFDNGGRKLHELLDALLSNKPAIKEITDILNRELDFQMQSTIQQLAVTFEINWDYIASTVDYLNKKERGASKFLMGDGLRDAALLLYLAKALNLSGGGFAALLKKPSLFGFDSSRSKIQVSLDTVRSVHAFAELVETFEKQGYEGKKTASVLADLALRWSFDDRTETDRKTLATLSGWEESQAKALQEHLGTMLKGNDDVDMRRGVSALAMMKRGFNFAAKLGVDVQMLIQLCKLHDEDDDPDDESYLDGYSAAAHGLLGLVKSKYSEDEWEKTFGPIRDHLNEHERDALVGLLMHQLRQDENKAVANHFDGMTSLQDLSDYLLIDVEMSGVAKVSKVKQGLNTLQRYIQRCHMGLEGEVEVTFAIGDKEWAWRSHYRLWEANRKVFLYPENYLGPGLRKLKTPLYKELEDELLQGDITEETVTKAYIHYFDKLDELANLKIVDACAATVTHPGAPDGEETLFFVGKTQNDPPVYYYRSAVRNEKGQIDAWRPWQKIALSIPVDTVTCLYADHRLHVFWVEEKTKTDRKEKTGKKLPTTTATIKFSYHNVSGNWLPPQVLETDVDVTTLPKTFLGRCGGPSPTNKELPEISRRVNPFHWEHVSTLENGVDAKTSPPSAPGGAIPQGDPLFLSQPRGAAANTNQAVLSQISPYWRGKGRTLVSKLLPENSGLRICNLVRNERTWHHVPELDSIWVNHVVAIGNHLFAGTDKGLYVGDDNGTEWNHVPKLGTNTINHIGSTLDTIDHVDRTRDYLFAGTDKGLYVGDDNGTEWNHVPELGTNGINHVVSIGNHLFAGTNQGFYVRDDNGAKWDHPSELKDLTISKVVAIPRYLFACTNTGLYELIEGEWNLVSELGDIDPASRCVKNISAIDDRLFACTFGGLFIREQNQKTWSSVKHLGRDGVSELGGNWVNQVVAIDDRLFASTRDGLYVSEDKGETWRYLCVLGEEEVVNNLVAVGDRLFASTSGGLVWRHKGNLTPLIDVAGDTWLATLSQPAEYGPAYRVCRATTTCVHKLRRSLVQGGLDTLLKPQSQSLAENSFEHLRPTDLVQKPYPADKMDFHPSSAYGLYFREIFFHIPFLIADTLNRNQRFEDAQKWYHYIFNPIASKNGDETLENRVWRYRVFRENTLKNLKANLADRNQLAKYTEDPFDPHAIAGLRLGAYEKAIVMKYIDNLLDWGDQLFAQDSWEYIVQAMMLYVLAQDLLGKKPKQMRLTHSPKLAKRYDKFNKKIDLADPFHVDDTKYFPVAANTNFADYWDRVEDRLFKIRHSMNIKGIVRQLALFHPPIDPRQLIRALAAGGDLASVTGELSAPVPYYRFTTMIHQAKNVTSTLTQLGSALSSVLEKKDAAQLDLLRSTHEKTILNLTTRLKEKQIEDAGKSLDSLNASLDSATGRRNHYRSLARRGLISQEQTSLSLTEDALIAQDLAHGIRGAAVAAHLIPTVFGFAGGCFQPGASVSEAAALSDAIGGIMSQQAGLATIQGQNARRKEEWALQETLAGHDVEQIQAQIGGAMLKREVAKKELEMHQKSIEQGVEREDLLRSKFTSHDLYQWMVGRISSVYFQTYKMAFDLAKAAEKAFQYERNTDDTLITFGYWDSLKKGLLAGEGLMLGLNQLEKAYMDDNERTLEIEKTISLRQINPQAWLDLRSKGKCNFDLKESLFDRDFPGHYCRKIASIAISIPAIVGPYQNVQATLIQQTSRVVLTNDIETIRYLLPAKPKDPPKKTPTADQLRSDPRAKQQIALSKGVNDSGLFELNFREERYLPFEGTGAVSSWELHMHKAANRIDFNSISDVIIHLRYTALDGGANLRDQVVELDPIKKDTGARLISLRQEYAAEWQAAKDDGADFFKIPIETGMFPMNLTSLKIGDITMWTVAKGKIEIAPAKPPAEPVKPHSKWSIKVPKDKLDSVDDIYLLVPFTGDLDWATPS